MAGKLSVVSSDADAIDIGSSTVSKEINALFKKLGHINITNLVANHAGAPETLPPTGSHTLAAGDHYFSGAQQLNGDLAAAEPDSARQRGAEPSWPEMTTCPLLMTETDRPATPTRCCGLGSMIRCPPNVSSRSEHRATLS